MINWRDPPILSGNVLAVRTFNVVERYSALGYDLVERPDYVNITGWRNKDGGVNKWCDRISVTYTTRRGDLETESFVSTTKPGLYYLLRPLNHKGTAILSPGFYKDAYTIGGFRGYQALRQVRSLKVMRDNNLDDLINPTLHDEGLFGIHIHRASGFPLGVDRWSAGCQVIKDSKDFERLMYLCERHKESWGNSFNYALIEVQGI